MHKQFDNLKAKVFGINADSPESHRKFIAKHDLKVGLLADTSHATLAAYGAWGTKKNDGKEYEGIIRSTYIIDPDGNFAFIWRNVKIEGHAENVHEKLMELALNSRIDNK